MNRQTEQPNQNPQTDRKISIVVPIMVAIIGGIFTVIAAIFGNYVGRGKAVDEVMTQATNTVDINIHSIDELITTYSQMSNDILDLKKQILELEKENESSKGNNNNNFVIEDTISERDQIEIDEILETLYNVQNEDINRDFFINLRTEINELELFYKTRMCMRNYKYSNIIIAFNEYGINCDDLSITEGTLELWDIECLYIYHRMQENTENSEEKTYFLEDYKIESIDKCNYKGFGLVYQDKTYDEISETFNSYIDSILEKMKRNSLPIG